MGKKDWFRFQEFPVVEFADRCIVVDGVKIGCIKSIELISDTDNVSEIVLTQYLGG